MFQHYHSRNSAKRSFSSRGSLFRNRQSNPLRFTAILEQVSIDPNMRLVCCEIVMVILLSVIVFLSLNILLNHFLPRHLRCAHLRLSTFYEAWKSFVEEQSQGFRIVTNHEIIHVQRFSRKSGGVGAWSRSTKGIANNQLS